MASDPPIRTVAAWDLIGIDGAELRVKGGRAIYEAAIYNDSTPGNMVRLARLESRKGGLWQVNRYVKADTPIEVLSDPEGFLAFMDGKG